MENQEAEKFLRRWVDPLLGREPTRKAPALLGLMMLVSAALCLWVARGTVYSGDELGWFNLAPGLSLSEALQPGSGHLLVVSRTFYAFILEVFGNHYVIFRLMTLVTAFLAVGLLFHWARRRVGDWFALAPCVALLFFGTDPGHLLQGNGFTIMLAIAAGMLALIALDRNSASGDIVACLALCLGVATYSVALAFLAGALVIVLTSQDRRRIWVFAVPAGLYLAWRLWVLLSGVDSTGGDPDPKDILLLPAWSFQSLSGILNALSGFHYNFGGGGWLPPGEMAGPPLALAFIAWVGWRVSRGTASSGLFVALVITITLFSMQVLTWVPAVRDPGTSRYLYPGAFAVLLILVESVRGMRLDRSALIAVWLVALSATATGAMLIRDSGASLRQRAVEVRGDITAVGLLDRSTGLQPGPGAIELNKALIEFDAADVVPAENEFGRIGYAPEEIGSAPPDSRDRIDAVLLAVSAPFLEPLASKPGPCFPAERSEGQTGSPLVTDLPGARTILLGKNGGSIQLRRFGEGFTHTVGELPAGRPVSLALPADDNPTPWQVMSADPDLEICDPKKP